MKKHVMAALVCMLLCAGAWAQHTAVVQSTNGKVEVRHNGEWEAASAGMELPLGATISTGFGASATVEVAGAVVDVRALTRMRIDELAEREGVLSAELFLPVGRVRAEVRGVQGLESEFRLRSTQATAAVRGTSFEFDGRNLRVLTGRVQLTNQLQQSVTVSGGEGSQVGDSGELAGGSETRERISAVQVAVTSFEDAATTFLQRRDELGTGAIRVEWTITDQETPQ
ncbi:MAG: hypothetical protein EA404_06250 [Spirochaetaceae bacterium]|nr:MAG: hypothetical protein EA404_06250 [Spirochaetaceae bacterium]